ncbi:ISXO2-like transposase domain-containing protein [Phthorimaea operculella]|nr:ISXO2-like transposase domain-containing protein [Phthorimaea operculella]
MDTDQPRPSCSWDNPTANQGVTEEPPPVKRRLYTEEVLGMWNLTRVVKELGTREQAIAFAEEQGLVPAPPTCRVHRVPMHVDLSANNTVGQFYCAKSSCRGKSRKSRTHGTWFENAKIDIKHIYYLMYCFSHRWSQDMVVHEDPYRNEREECLSRTTIIDWYSYGREVVVIFQLDQQQKRGKIGGEGKIVQVDESKFGKRKYNRGRRLEGHWVLGLIEDGSEDLRLEVCPENIRSADVLVPLIQKHVEEGTTIHTDYWRAYDCLGDYGYIHKKVNHSDPDNPFVANNGTHTQRTQWRVVKRFFYKDNFNHPGDFAELIVEYVWRRHIIKYKKDPFVELIKAIKYVYNN